MQPLGHGKRKGSFLLATGQATSYVDYDDGYYEKGIAKAYTVLTAGQYSGTVNITLNAKTDAHSNNCVFDHNTGLMWSRYASASVGAGSNGFLPWTTNGDGEGIFPYCAAANAASLGGHADWRVPNIYEIFLLTNSGGVSPIPNTTAFPSFSTAATYASSTTLANPDTSYSMSVDFFLGEVRYAVKTTSYFVLLLRG